MKPTLIDSSFLYALYSPDDASYSRAQQVAETATLVPMVPEVALNEVMYLFRYRQGVRAARAFIRKFPLSGITTVSLVEADYSRIADIMQTYESAAFDFVDCAIMALAERLSITHICSYDRRDFSIFRPRHCDFFTLLPE